MGYSPGFNFLWQWQKTVILGIREQFIGENGMHISGKAAKTNGVEELVLF